VVELSALRGAPPRPAWLWTTLPAGHPRRPSTSGGRPRARLTWLTGLAARGILPCRGLAWRWMCSQCLAKQWFIIFKHYR